MHTAWPTFAFDSHYQQADHSTINTRLPRPTDYLDRFEKYDPDPVASRLIREERSPEWNRENDQIRVG